MSVKFLLIVQTIIGNGKESSMTVITCIHLLDQKVIRLYTTVFDGGVFSSIL